MSSLVATLFFLIISTFFLLKDDRLLPVRIGVVLPVTGDFATYGALGIQGAKMAVKEINSSGGVLGGRPLELVIKDNESDPNLSVNLMSLRLKIFLWLTLILLPVIIVIYLNYSSQREAETERYLKMSSLTVENGAKELNNYLRLKSTTFTLLFEELLRSAIDPVNVIPEKDIQLGMLMALNPGFSMIPYTNKQAKIQYAKTAVSRSNLHLLPRDITGQTAFTRERQQLFVEYIYSI
ncbi:MAG: ABC transporter substrate-binding protein [Proteobacteria bacterium]|nr:ABC transporter substrate-binding protein [Pseudomonadota bacterium]MBU1419085.1 ABC transporter substrate-binding protein [Pseudomonadota bacterium]MBU1456467.1 ABC transporter substrate-binding protein [Pseudomonadota bacterium]